ncbi:hypothetical protein H8356DRAFT_1671951 [Neocallimastix lanati (nom. inval.)]|nr:hypothetical protein H8356DRAFT_1671951 [Neocallimastix sp. JGI-2020a]
MEDENIDQIKTCLWCNNDFTGRTRLFCHECLQKMREMVSSGRNRIENPKANQCCVMCGKNDGRKMYLFKEDGNPKDGIPVCDLCIEEDMKHVERLFRIR